MRILGGVIVAAIAWLGAAPLAAAQDAATSCDAAAKAAYDADELTPFVEQCAAEGNAIAEGVLGMTYLGTSDSQGCDPLGCSEPPADAASRDDVVINRKWVEGWRLLRESADKGWADAQNEVGLGYLEGYYGLTPDPVMARQWFEKAAAGGDIIAPYNLARLYLSGSGVAASLPTAERYIRESLSRGYEDARCSLAALLEKKGGVGFWTEAQLVRWRYELSHGRFCTPDWVMAELQ